MIVCLAFQLKDKSYVWPSMTQNQFMHSGKKEENTEKKWEQRFNFSFSKSHKILQQAAI